MDYTLPSDRVIDIEKLHTILSDMPVTGISQANGSITLHLSSELTIDQKLQAEEAIALTPEFNSIPQIVSPRQMRIALIISGISPQDIESALDTLPEPNRSIAKTTWEYSVEFQRNNPILISLAPMLGLTEQQVDDLFTLASTL
jgi:hypothetical protein